MRIWRPSKRRARPWDPLRIAVGVALFEALTGALPFRGDFASVLSRKVGSDAPAPSAFNRAVPPDLDALCSALLQRDEHLRPHGAEVLRRLRRDGPRTGLASVPPSTDEAPAAPLIGRAAELETLERAGRSARSHAVSVVVRGESGVGKSALVQRYLSQHAEAGGWVLASRCYERESVPFKAIDGLIDALAHRLASDPEPPAVDVGLLTRTFPVLRMVPAYAEAHAEPAKDAAEARARLFGSLRALLAALANRAPLLLFIDDLHWTDQDSLELLGDLLRGADPPRLLLIATTRPLGAAAGLRPFGLPGDVRPLDVGRLTPEDAEAYARALLGGAPRSGELAATLARESGGHPLLLDELVRQALAEASRASSNAVGLDEVLARRVRRLEDSTRHVLETIALAGTAVDTGALAEATDLDLAALERELNILRAGRFTRTARAAGATSVECYHDRIRESTAGRLTAERAREGHRRLGVALERRGAEADRLLAHWLGAGDTPRALRACVEAATQAERALAFERAARLYGQALELSGGEAPLELREAHAVALFNGGRCEEAGRAFAQTADRAAHDPARQLELRRRGAEALLMSGHVSEGVAELRRVLAAVSIRYPESVAVTVLAFLFYRFVVWARGLSFRERDGATLGDEERIRLDACWTVARSLSTVDTLRGGMFQARALLGALRGGDPARIARALALEAAYVSIRGPRGAARAAQLHGQAAQLAERTADPYAVGMVLGTRGWSALLCGQFRLARSLCEEAAQLLREQCVGAPWESATHELFVLWALSYLGELELLAARVERRTREADERGDVYIGVCLRAGINHAAWLREGDVARAEDALEQARARWPAHEGFHNQDWWILMGAINLDLYRDTPAAAHERLERAWSSLRRSLVVAVQITDAETLALRGRIAVALARHERGDARSAALERGEHMARRLRRMDAPVARPYAAAVEGAVARQRGHLAAAKAHLEEALGGFARLDMMAYAASARRALGELLGGDEGAALRAMADQWFAGQGVAAPEGYGRMYVPGCEP